MDGTDPSPRVSVVISFQYLARVKPIRYNKECYIKARPIDGECVMSLPDSAQFRAARAMLEWSRIELARAAGVSVATVSRAEGQGSGKASEGEAGAIRVALETAGIRFVEDQGEGAGVTFRPR